MLEQFLMAYSNGIFRSILHSQDLSSKWFTRYITNVEIWIQSFLFTNLIQRFVSASSTGNKKTEVGTLPE